MTPAPSPAPTPDAPRDLPPDPALPPGWIPRRTADGSVTLRHPVHGQACHSDSGAWTEAVERYAAALELVAAPADRPLRLLDLGTGPGWNLAAARAWAAERGRRLTVLALELEPGLPAAAPRLAELSGEGAWCPWFPDLAADLAAAVGGTTSGTVGTGDATGETAVEEPRSGLDLRLGDARPELAALRAAGRRFDAVFLDAFSPGVEPDLWAPAVLADLAALLDEGGVVATYTVSLAVRVELARAGLTVGTGPRVGAKAGGTLAARGLDLPPLESRAAAKLGRRLARTDGTPSGGGT